MFNGILIVEQAGNAPHGGEAALWVDEDWKDCRRVTWDRFEPETILRGGLRLLILNAVGAAEEARGFFGWARLHPVGAPVCAIVAAEDAELLQAAAEVVDEFLLGPVRPEELRRRVSRLLGSGTCEVEEVAARLAAEIGMQQMVGRDPAFQRVMTQMVRFAGNDAPVLLTGETGKILEGGPYTAWSSDIAWLEPSGI